MGGKEKGTGPSTVFSDRDTWQTDFICVGSQNCIVFCSFQVGHGTRVLNESIIVEWTVPRQLEVKYIGFSTGWGSMGEFKIWRKEETDENHNEAFTLGVPHNIIPGSERATASIIGINYEEVSQGTSYQI